MRENVYPRLPHSTARGSGISIAVCEIDAGSSGTHLGLTLAPINEYLKTIEDNLHIAVGCIHELLTVNADIDLLQTLFRQGNRIAIAKDRVRTGIILVLIGGYDIKRLEERRRLIDGFVNSVIVYDEYIVITFNYKEGTTTVPFSKLDSSDLSSVGGPKSRKSNCSFCFFFLYEMHAIYLCYSETRR